MIVKIPRGNILVFGAWNHPILTAINSIAPAIISGNGVSFRPSSQTHFMGQIFEKVFEKLDCPKRFSSYIISSQDDEGNSASKIFMVLYILAPLMGGENHHQLEILFQSQWSLWKRCCLCSGGC